MFWETELIHRARGTASNKRICRSTKRPDIPEPTLMKTSRSSRLDLASRVKAYPATEIDSLFSGCPPFLTQLCKPPFMPPCPSYFNRRAAETVAKKPGV